MKMRETISRQIERSRKTYFFCRLILLSVSIALVVFTLLPFTVKTSGDVDPAQKTLSQSDASKPSRILHPVLSSCGGNGHLHHQCRTFLLKV